MCGPSRDFTCNVLLRITRIMMAIIMIKIKITTVIVRIVAERSYSFDVNNGDNCG